MLAINFSKIMYIYHAGALAVFGGYWSTSRSVEILNGTAWEVIGELEGSRYFNGMVQLPCPIK
jgi:hypothetical protein